MDRCLRKIVAFVKKRVVVRPGHSIAETVAEVECCRMAAFSEKMENVTGVSCLVFTERKHIDVQTADKVVEVLRPVFAQFRLRHDAALDERWCSNSEPIGVFNGGDVATAVGLPAENRDDGRGVENHVGSPCAS